MSAHPSLQPKEATAELFKTLMNNSKRRQVTTESVQWKQQKQREERARMLDNKIASLARKRQEIEDAAKQVIVRPKNYYEAITVVTELMDELIWQLVCGEAPYILNDKRLDEVVDQLGLNEPEVVVKGNAKRRAKIVARPTVVQEE